MRELEFICILGPCYNRDDERVNSLFLFDRQIVLFVHLSSQRMGRVACHTVIIYSLVGCCYTDRACEASQFKSTIFIPISKERFSWRDIAM